MLICVQENNLLNRLVDLRELSLNVAGPGQGEEGQIGAEAVHQNLLRHVPELAWK